MCEARAPWSLMCFVNFEIFGTRKLEFDIPTGPPVTSRSTGMG